MLTWNAVQQHMRTTFKLQHEEPDAFTMTWRYDDGRAQRIVVRRYLMGDQDMVEFKSPFARLGGPDPVELLRENARLPFGAVALSSEVYLIVHNAQLGTMSMDTFDMLLTRVAGLADRLEQKHGSEDRF